LASIRAQWDAAEAHFEHALELNGRMGAIPWLAHTRVQYSRQLLRRGRREDVERAGRLLDEAVAVARQHGMHGLRSRVSGGSTVD
jgi:hypothetical protein